MVKITTKYAGQLRCVSTHGPSGNELTTDAPVDNNGKGETFSPTDLVVTALASCIETIMGIVAERKEIQLEGLVIEAEKHMSDDMPRRIARIPLTIHMPLPEDHKYASALVNAAHTCPVHQSIHPDIEVPIEWVWK